MTVKPRPRIKARPQRETTTKRRKPQFLCHSHATPQVMVYSQERVRWECPDPSCPTKEQAKGPTPDTTTTLSSKPQLVLKEDEDGDVHAVLTWPDYGLMCALPFKDTVIGSRPGTGGTMVRIEFPESEVVRIDRNGHHQ